MFKNFTTIEISESLHDLTQSVANLGDGPTRKVLRETVRELAKELCFRANGGLPETPDDPANQQGAGWDELLN